MTTQAACRLCFSITYCSCGNREKPFDLCRVRASNILIRELRGGGVGGLGRQNLNRRYDPVKALLEEYVPRVYRFALRLTQNLQDAEDLTQETCLRAWRHRGRLRDLAAVRVWLFTIAANLWRDRLRRRKREPRVLDALGDDPQAPAAPPDREAMAREEHDRVVEAMDRLPPRQREVLFLHALEQLPLGEIAQVLGISVDAVKASLSLARRRMRERFQTATRDAPGCVSSTDEQARM